MENLRSFLHTIMEHPWFELAIRLVFMWVLIWGLTTLVRRLYRRYAAKFLSPQVNMLMFKAIQYISVFLMVVYTLSEFGISLTALLGAAGIAGIGIGFAARTSLSNIISGIFILSERELKIDDIITNGSFGGTLVSIDLLSVSLQTFDNKLIRIPNEYFVKNITRNMTYYKKRRIDLLVHVDLESDILLVKKILEKSVSHAQYVLKDPATSVSLSQISSISHEFSVNAWVKTADFSLAFEPIALNIREALAKEDIVGAIKQQNAL